MEGFFDKTLLVKNKNFQRFLEENFYVLKDSCGKLIMTELTHFDGEILINTKLALKMIISYIRTNNLLFSNERTAFILDDNLKIIFQDFYNRNGEVMHWYQILNCTRGLFYENDNEMLDVTLNLCRMDIYNLNNFVKYNHNPIPTKHLLVKSR